jgi:hypothetical protein
MIRASLIAKLFLILCASTFNVRVKAGRIEEPRGCLSQNVECAVYNPTGALVFNMQDNEVRLAPGASIVKKGPDVLRIVRGNVLIKAKSGLRVEGLFASMYVKDGGVLVESSDDSMKLTNMSADVRYRPRGYETDLELPKGLMNEMGRVSTSGEATAAYPRSMGLKPLIDIWAKCFKKNEFKILQKDFENFLTHWKAGLDFVGPWYRETVTREIAEHEAELERQKRVREAREREEKYYREMFKRKNFLD